MTPEERTAILNRVKDEVAKKHMNFNNWDDYWELYGATSIEMIEEIALRCMEEVTKAEAVHPVEKNISGWFGWIMQRIPIPNNSAYAFWIKQAMQGYADDEAKAFANWLSNTAIAGRTMHKLFIDYKKETSESLPAPPINE